MRLTKHKVIRLIFMLEIALFVYGYGWGGHGITKLLAHRKINQQLADTIIREKAALQEINDQIEAWNNEPFYKEKYAREQLQMARADEIVYT